MVFSTNKIYTYTLLHKFYIIRKWRQANKAIVQAKFMLFYLKGSSAPFYFFLADNSVYLLHPLTLSMVSQF